MLCKRKRTTWKPIEDSHTADFYKVIIGGLIGALFVYSFLLVLLSF